MCSKLVCSFVEGLPLVSAEFCSGWQLVYVQLRLFQGLLLGFVRAGLKFLSGGWRSIISDVWLFWSLS